MNNFYKKYIASHEKIYLHFIFIIGWLALLLQHSCVGMYFDDYGNAALAYGYNVPGVAGTNYTITDILEWAKWIYFNWGGRLLYACLILIPMLKKGIGLYMFVQSIVLVLILYFIYKIACKVRNKNLSLGMAIVVFILYGLIGREFHVNGTYWASASILYIWPLLPTLIAIYYYANICLSIKKNKKINFTYFYVFEGVAIVFTTLSQEQIGGSIIVFFIMYIVLHHLKDYKKYLKVDLYVFALSIISYIVLFAAPGNFARMSNSDEFSKLSILGKIGHNLPLITEIFTCHDMNIFNILFIIANIFAIIMILRNNFSNIINIILGLTTLVTSASYLLAIRNIENKIWMTYIFMLFLINMSLVAWRYFYIKNKQEFMAFLISAAASVFCLLVSPSIVHRSFIQFIIFAFAYILILIFDFYDLFCLEKIVKYIWIIGLSVLGFNSYHNYETILKGYYENKFYEDYNCKQLKGWKDKQDPIIVLLKYPNSLFRGLAACDDTNFDGIIEGWLHEYYDIPTDVDIKWTELETYNVSNIFTEYREGFYDLEGSYSNNWRWSYKESMFSIYNFTDKPLDIEFIAKVSTDYDEISNLLVKFGEQVQEFNISKNEKNIVCPIRINPGDNIINITTDAKQVQSAGDGRSLFVKFRNIKVKYK